MAKSESRPAHNLRGIVLRSLSVMCFAVTIAAMKKASEDGVVAMEMIFYRSLFGLPLVLAWLIAGPGIRVIRTKRPGAHLIRSAIGLIGILMNFVALIRLPLADAVTIGFSAPIFATIVSGLLLGDKIGPHRWAAVVFGFLGVAMIVRPGATSLDQFGLLMAIGGAIGTATVTITVRQLGGTEHAGAIVFWFFICAGVASGIGSIFLGQAHMPQTWALLVLGGLFGAAAQVLMTMSLQAAPVSVVSPFDYLQIVWATLIGWLVWSVGPSLGTLAGGALIVGSGLYTAWREHRRNRNVIPATPPLE
ncbi:DMT family transporter [Sphingomonas sp. SRS2]|uniref:DMT family transporter n=1 Tax=Sphingomonas sp. SRS2 TaxID=133190 RepID=UPI000A737EE9|nr:DMT family transporter [Sphingomonas sp. SRS2]